MIPIRVPLIWVVMTHAHNTITLCQGLQSIVCDLLKQQLLATAVYK